MKASALGTDEYAPFYAGYIELAQNLELLDGLKENYRSSLNFFSAISEEDFNYSYAEGKWTIKELLQHIIDAERVFAYRALRIARGDKTKLPGFSQDDYVLNSDADKRDKNALIAEYRKVRKATIALFESFNEEMLTAMGTASDCPTSVRAVGFIIIGHESHHIKIIGEHYL